MSENKKGSSADGFFERLAIPPDEHEIMLTDINKEGLEEIGDNEGIVNLSPAVFPKVAFPVNGLIYGENNRLMISLVCRRFQKSAATINVWFVIDSGSNCTFLARETIEALIGEGDPFPKAIGVAIQDPDSNIQCHVSPPNSHFVDANVLGMQAILKLNIWFGPLNSKHSTFCLVNQ